MNYTNVIMAIDEETWGYLLQNYELDENGDRVREDLTDAQAKALRHISRTSWNALDISGVNYKIIDMYMPNLFEENGELTWVNFLQTKWPNRFIVIVAFQINGAPLGITIHPPLYDENGDILPNTPPDDSGDWNRSVKYLLWWKGTQVYPQHPRALEAMPDVDTDKDGVPDSPATEFPESLSGRLGWKERMWI